MKVFSINKWAFYGICILILALPVSRQWKLLATGKKATGTVLEFTMIVHENLGGNREIQYVSEIQFTADGHTYKTYGPDNTEYEVGRKINVMYNPRDPEQNCLLTFSSIYFNDYFILPLVLITLWLAFYLSFNSYLRRAKKMTWK